MKCMAAPRSRRAPVPLLRADPPEHSKKPVTVRAIHANAGVAAWYYERLERLLADMHSEAERDLLAAYAEICEEPEFAQDAANPALLIRAALRKWGLKWISKFDAVSVELAQKFAGKSFGVTQTALRAALKDAGFTVTFAPTPASRAAYQAVVAEQVNLIKSIPQEYLKDVQSKVWSSVMKGADMHALSVDLRKTYGVSRDRAATIARDQNNKAKAVIERTRRQELGITHAIWQHSAGGKVPRATHVAMSGKPYPLSQGMWDSAEKKYVMPGELINCRCTSRAVIPAFETVEQAKRRSPETALLRAARGRAR
jgi:uncharacterized protein with gpF-like domain